MKTQASHGRGADAIRAWLGATLIALSLIVLNSNAQIFLEEEKDPYLGLGKQHAELVFRYMEISALRTYYHDVVESVIAKFRLSFPQIEPSFWKEFKQYHTTPDHLLDRLAPIYGKRLSVSELESIVTFLESPSGRKYIAVLPQIGKEVTTATAEFEEALNRNIILKLRDSGYAGF